MLRLGEHVREVEDARSGTAGQVFGSLVFAHTAGSDVFGDTPERLLPRDTGLRSLGQVFPNELLVDGRDGRIEKLGDVALSQPRIAQGRNGLGKDVAHWLDATCGMGIVMAGR